MKRLIYLSIALIMIGCKTECEKNGGKLVISHYIPMLVMVGKSFIVNQVPQYKCEDDNN